MADDAVSVEKLWMILTRWQRMVRNCTHYTVCRLSLIPQLIVRSPVLAYPCCCINCCCGVLTLKTACKKCNNANNTPEHPSFWGVWWHFANPVCRMLILNVSTMSPNITSDVPTTGDYTHYTFNMRILSRYTTGATVPIAAVVLLAEKLFGGRFGGRYQACSYFEVILAAGAVVVAEQRAIG
jgi:hypothetical protein